MENFICPKCNKKSLIIEGSFDAGDDDYSDEIKFQTIKCESCGFKGVAVYEESFRGNMEEDSFNHYGYMVLEDRYDEVVSDMNSSKVKKMSEYTEGAEKFVMEF